MAFRKTAPPTPKAPPEWQHGYHRSKGGELYRISEMGDEHLKNTLDMAKRNGIPPHGIEPLRLECEIRGLLTN